MIILQFMSFTDDEDAPLLRVYLTKVCHLKGFMICLQPQATKNLSATIWEVLWQQFNLLHRSNIFGCMNKIYVQYFEYFGGMGAWT
jgi:hypothetical protein